MSRMETKEPSVTLRTHSPAPQSKLNPSAKEYVPKFTPQQEVNLTKLFKETMVPKVNQVNAIDGYHRQSLALNGKKKTLPVYYTTRRIPNERFQVQRQRQYKTLRQVKPKGKTSKHKGWMKDQEGWTQVTKKLRVRKNDTKGLRYKGSKQFRDPVPKRKPKPVAPRVVPRQVFNIKANKVFINNKPDPPKSPLSNNYYNVLDFDDDDHGCMYQPKFKGTKPKCSYSWKEARERWKAMREYEKAKQAKTKARRERRKKIKARNQACVFATGLSNSSFGRNTWLGDTAASTHMGNSDDGMTDVEEVKQTIMIGNGKTLMATKIGTLHRVVYQDDGSYITVQLKDYKYVPDLHVNLFSITKSLDQGWKLSNDGVIMKLKKGPVCLKFDKVFKTDNGKVVGVELLPTSGRKGDGYAFPTTDGDADPVPDPVPSKTESKKGPSWDINRMHRVFNHASETVLRKTAQEQGWTLTGKFETCKDCQESNAKQKGVAKVTTDRCDNLVRGYLLTSLLSRRRVLVEVNFGLWWLMMLPILLGVFS